MSTTSTTTWWQDMYADIDHQRLDGLEARLAEDVVVNMAGNPPAVGRDTVMAGQREFLASFRSLRHDFTHTWEVGDTAILEAVVTYVRHDGQAVEVPCVSIVSRNSAGLVDTVRIYLDLAPVFA